MAMAHTEHYGSLDRNVLTCTTVEYFGSTTVVVMLSSTFHASRGGWIQYACMPKIGGAVPS